MAREDRHPRSYTRLTRPITIAACSMLVVDAWAENSQPPPLKDKSNEELLHIIIGGKNAWLVEEEAKIKTHLPDGFWTMPSKDAALALLAANSDSKVKQRFEFTTSDTKTAPPSRGEAGLRWSCFHCVTANNGSMELRYREQESQLEYAIVDSFDVHDVRRARNQRRSIALPQNEARQLYEVIWWLGKVKAVPKSEPSDFAEASAEFVFTTADSDARFWVSSLRSPTKTSLPVLNLSEQLAAGFDLRAWASCTEFLLTEALERRNVNLNQPTLTLPPDPERERLKKFESENKPDPRSVDETKKWVTRLVGLLSDRKEPIRYDRIVNALVPEADPLRYSDPRIDSILFRFVTAAVDSSASDKNVGMTLDGSMAARALALRGRPELFPLLMRVVGDSKVKDGVWKESAFEAAVVLAERQTQFRAEMVSLIKADAKKLGGSDSDAIWRLNLREFKSEVEGHATTSPDEIEITRSDGNAPRRFHRARAILIAWNEQDALTKLKLDALIGASSRYMIRAPDFVRTEYEQLPPDQEELFREFLTWMEAQEFHYGLRPEEVKCLIRE